MSNPALNPAVTGVTARYQGAFSSNNTSTFWYWVQALYDSGWGQLGESNEVSNAPSSFTNSNFIAVQWNVMPNAIAYRVFRTTTSTAPALDATAIFLATSETGFKDDGSIATFTATPRYDGVQVYRAIYSFADDGGAVGAITPKFSDTIPANTILYGGVVNSSTAVTSGGSATVAIGTTAGSAANSILAATAKTSFTIDAVIEVLGTNSQAATHAASFKMTAAGQINITVGTAALTAGVIEIFVLGSIATTV